MDHQPPPFFKRGPAPLARLSFYSALSLALIFFDARFQTLELLRQGVSLLTHPIQQAAHAPMVLLDNASDYFFSITRFQEENARLKRERLVSAETQLRTRQLEAENERLRKLLDVKARQQVNGQVTQILYAARDPFSRRVIVDKGEQNNIVAGQPVIDDSGVVGQVTRVFPFVSEITLITDKDQAVPVQIVRLLGRPGEQSLGVAAVLAVILVIVTLAVVLIVDRWSAPARSSVRAPATVTS